MHLKLCAHAPFSVQFGPALKAHHLCPVVWQFGHFILRLSIESSDQKNILIREKLLWPPSRTGAFRQERGGHG